MLRMDMHIMILANMTDIMIAVNEANHHVHQQHTGMKTASEGPIDTTTAAVASSDLEVAVHRRIVAVRLVHTETAADVPTEATAEVMVVTMEAAKVQYGTNHTDPLDTPAKVKVHHLDIDTDGGIGMGKHLIIAKLAYRRTSQHMRIEQDIILATVGHAKRLGPTVSTRSSPKGRLSLASVVPYRMDKVTVPYYLPLGQL